MDNLSEMVWSLSLEGGPDESAGSSSDGAGWVGIFRGAFSADDLPEATPEELAQALAESFTNGNGSEVVDRIKALPTARAVVVGIRTAQALGNDAHRLISRLER